MVTLPLAGQEDWDVPLNAALNDLQDAIDTHESADDPHGAKLYADATFLPKAIITVDDLLAQDTFTIAHRGSGDEFPEHTMEAYRSAVAAGCQAIEVSVHLTADGVPVCMHDGTLDRTTDTSGNTEDKTWAQYQNAIEVTPQAFHGAGWSNVKAPTMREVLDEFLGKVVIFLEAKSNGAIVAVQDILEDFYPQAGKSVVWKNYYTSNSFAWAHNHGFKTWGYIDSDTTASQMDAVDDDVDFWGPPHTSSDAQIQMVVARGKPVIGWEVHRHAEAARFTALGCQGLMESGWLYLNNTPALTADTFSDRISVPGTLGVANYDPVYALKYDATGRAHIDELPYMAVLMGGHRAPATGNYTIGWSMTWDDLGSDVNLHSDLALCRSADDPYQFFNANDSLGGYGSPGGYHVVIRRSGTLQIYEHTQGSTSSTKLGEITSATPVAGTPMSFTIQVTDTQLILTRTDVDPDVTLTVTDDTYRGRYWHLGVGSIVNDAEKPYYTNVSIS